MLRTALAGLQALKTNLDVLTETVAHAADTSPGEAGYHAFATQLTTDGLKRMPDQ